MNNTFDESAIVTPASAEEVAEVVRAAQRDKFHIRTTRWSADNGVPLNGMKIVELTKMTSVVDYPARDMTITVEAGMLVHELQNTLQTEGQQLPVDCFDTSLTVGAMVASDVAGPRQYGYGTLRDYVIGIEAVDGLGRVFHAGGRVVKNVAGYDISRLMVGSRGSLGILTRLTFKLKPIPAASKLRHFHFETRNEFEASLERLNTTHATPVILDFACGTSGAADACDQPSPYTLKIGVEGDEAACDWQLEELQRNCEGAAEPRISEQSEPTDNHCRGAGFGWNANVFRIRTRPSRLPEIADGLASRGLGTQGHAGNGILYVHDTTDDQSAGSACSAVTKQEDFVSQWATDHPSKVNNRLTTRLLKTMDPHSIFCS